MKTTITRNEITTIAPDGTVYTKTRQEVLARLRQARMDNDYRFVKIHEAEIAQMNSAKN